MGWDEWENLPWWEQRTLLENLAEDPDVPFGWSEGSEGEAAPTRRVEVDAGVDVIDLTAMREQLEAERARQQSGGVTR